MSESSSRRAFLQATTAAAAGAAIPAVARPQAVPGRDRVVVPVDRAPSRPRLRPRRGRAPRAREERVAASGSRGGVRVETAAFEDRLAVRVASDVPLRRVELRWARRAPAGLRLLGDHWERGYGDLEWRGVVPERPMPWYFLTHDGQPHARLRRAHGRRRPGSLAPGRRGREPLARPALRRARGPARRPDARSRDSVVAREGHERRVGLRCRTGLLRRACTSGRSCRRRPSTAATAGTAPTTASTPTSSDR